MHDCIENQADAAGQADRHHVGQSGTHRQGEQAQIQQLPTAPHQQIAQQT